MTIDYRRFTAVAKGQLGSFSRRQAHAAGISDRQLRRRVQSGFLEQIGPHSFRLLGGADGPAGDVFGLVLDIGEPIWVSGPTAAALHGFDGFDCAGHCTSPSCATGTCVAWVPWSTPRVSYH